MHSAIEEAAGLLRRSTYTVGLTGAGISTPSGIPDFRSPHAGLWSNTDPLAVASVWAFNQHPDVFYHWFRPLLQKCQAAEPNTGHRILAAMEKQGCLQALITQNIDSLHQQAGSRRVLEVHGHTRTATCIQCGMRLAGRPLWDTVLAGGSSPLCPACGCIVKPDVILFGEPLPYEVLLDAQQEALRCEAMLVIGTSLEVMPAADLPLLARRRGARIVLINLEPTSMDRDFDIVVHADVERSLARLWHLLRR